MTKPRGLTSPLAMKAFPPSQLPTSVAGRLAFVHELLHGLPIYDDDGEPTGEYTEPLISKATARRLLDDMGEAAP